MDFHEKARNAMRSASPEGKEEKRRRILLSAAEWNLDKLKGEILHRLSRGEAVGSRLCAAYDIPYDGNDSDSIPYGNLFAAETGYDGSRRGGLIGFHDTDRQSLTIRDLAALREFRGLLAELARRDGITLGEPFIRAEYRDARTKNVTREKHFFPGGRSLSGHGRGSVRRFGASVFGEEVRLLLSVDYVYTVR